MVVENEYLQTSYCYEDLSKENSQLNIISLFIHLCAKTLLKSFVIVPIVNRINVIQLVLVVYYMTFDGEYILYIRFARVRTYLDTSVI